MIIFSLLLTVVYWLVRSQLKLLYKRYYLDTLLLFLLASTLLFSSFSNLNRDNALSIAASLFVFAIGIYHLILVVIKLRRVDERYRWIHYHDRAVVNYDIPHQTFAITTEDGVRIYGINIPNPTAPAQKAIIVCHGASRTKYTAPVVQTCMILALEYNVFCFDFRGHMDSSGTFYLDGEEIDRDLAAVIDYVQKSGFTSIAVVGWSMGGSAALRCAGSGLPIQALVAGSPAMEIPDISEMRLMRNPFTRWLVKPIMLVTRQASLSVHKNGQAISTTLSKARQIPAIPLLLVYNDYDYVLRITGEQFEQYFAELPPTKTLLKLPGRGHLFDWPNNYIFWEKLMAWLRVNF